VERIMLKIASKQVASGGTLWVCVCVRIVQDLSGHTGSWSQHRLNNSRLVPAMFPHNREIQLLSQGEQAGDSCWIHISVVWEHGRWDRQSFTTFPHTHLHTFYKNLISSLIDLSATLNLVLLLLPEDAGGGVEEMCCEAKLLAGYRGFSGSEW